jgi:hypothetical protein
MELSPDGLEIGGGVFVVIVGIAAEDFGNAFPV